MCKFLVCHCLVLVKLYLCLTIGHVEISVDPFYICYHTLWSLWSCTTYELPRTIFIRHLFDMRRGFDMVSIDLICLYFYVQSLVFTWMVDFLAVYLIKFFLLKYYVYCSFSESVLNENWQQKLHCWNYSRLLLDIGYVEMWGIVH